MLDSGNQNSSMELVRKKYSACRKTLSEVGKTINQADRAELQGLLDKTNQQLLWIRMAQSKLEENFEGRHATSLQAELSETATQTDKMIFDAFVNRKFGKDNNEIVALRKSVEVARALLEKRTGLRSSIGELVTYDVADNEYLTTFIILRNVKVKGDSQPMYIVAISKGALGVNYITHLSSLAAMFTPVNRWTALSDLTDAVRRKFTWHFSGEHGLTLAEAVKQIDHTSIENGTLRVTLSPGCPNVEEVLAVIYLTLSAEADKTNNTLNVEYYNHADGTVLLFNLRNSRVWFERIPHITKMLKLKLAA
jgi:hypothetical protein